MRFYVSLFYLLYASFALATEDKIQVVDFDQYKSGRPLLDDSQCLELIWNSRSPTMPMEIRFGPQTYEFKRMLADDAIRGKVSFVGSRGTTFQVESGFLRLAAIGVPIPLQSNMDSSSSTLGTISSALSGSLVRFSSMDTVESSWGYRATDLAEVTVNGESYVTFKDKLNFMYLSGRDYAELFSPAEIAFHRIEFVTSTDVGPVIILTGLRPTFENCQFVSNSIQPKQILVRLESCYAVHVEDVEVRGKSTYGFLLNGCRHVVFRRISSKECLHPVVPATFTTHVLVDGFKGYGSTIDAHPSFDVHYKNVYVKEGEYYWNCRALGVTLENCRLEAKNGIADISVYIGVVNLRPEFNYLYDRYDVTCRKVHWLYKDLGFNGLHVHRCRDFVVEDSRTHAVSTGDQIRSLRINDCDLGRVYGGGRNTIIEDTHFDARLLNSVEGRSPLSLNYAHNVEVRQSRFSGYESVALFRSAPPLVSNVIFLRCRLKGFTCLIETGVEPVVHSANISFLECTFPTSAGKKFEIAVQDLVK